MNSKFPSILRRITHDKKYIHYVLLGCTGFIFCSVFSLFYLFNRIPVPQLNYPGNIAQRHKLLSILLSSKSAMQEICKFGVITDLQYANIDNGTNYFKTRTRRYRYALEHLKNAIRDWKRDPNIQFVIHLGDIIDRHSKLHGKAAPDLHKVLETFRTLEKPVFYIWGNHEFYNMERKEMFSITEFNSSLHPAVNPGKDLFQDYNDQTYFEWSPCTGFRIVALDTYDISMLGVSKGDPRYDEAQAILQKHNPNADLNSPLNMAINLQRFVQYNGGLGEKQLKWLEEVLSTADLQQEHVIVVGHIPLDPAVSDPSCILWNYQEVVSVLHRHPSVRAYFAGHSHDVSSHTDEHGLVHVVFPGVIELPPDTAGHATVTLARDAIIIEGEGEAKEISQIIKVPSLSNST